MKRQHDEDDSGERHVESRVETLEIPSMLIGGILPEIWSDEICTHLSLVDRVKCRPVCKRHSQYDKEIRLPKWLSDIIWFTSPAVLPFETRYFLNHLQMLGWPNLKCPFLFGLDIMTCETPLQGGRQKHCLRFVVSWRWVTRDRLSIRCSQRASDSTLIWRAQRFDRQNGKWNRRELPFDRRLAGLLLLTEAKDIRRYIRVEYGLTDF